VNRRGTLVSLVALLATGCASAPAASPADQPLASPTNTSAATSTDTATPLSTTGSSQPTTGPTPGATPEVINLADPPQPAGASAREHLLVAELRDDTGFAALIGPSGAGALAALDRIEEEFAARLIAEIAAAIDAGELPGASTTGGVPMGLLTSLTRTPADRTAARTALDEIEVSLFANTGFTASTIMTLYSGIVARAGETGHGSLPRHETFDQVIDGLRHQVDLNTTFEVDTGEGRVTADLILAATDRISNPATGAFVALYTSRSTGHFDVNACPDDFGIAAGTYTFETKHELNDVSSPDAAQSGAGRSVEAPFQLIDGDDAHLQRVDAQLDMAADGRGPGSTGGPGPTSAFDWGATQSMDISMPAGSSSAWNGSPLTVTGTGGEQAGGSMFISAAMAQLFLQQVAKEAEAFWRKGECIEIQTTKESKKVGKGETVEFEASAIGHFDKQDIDAPIKGEFSGKKSLEPQGAPQDPPASFTFVAGDEEGDKGTIDLEQVGVRGIGKKTLEFEVGIEDYRISNARAPLGSLSATKCDGVGGRWTIAWTAPNLTGTTEFSVPDDGGTAPAHSDITSDVGGAKSHYVLDGSASVTVPDVGDPILHFDLGRGKVTVTAFGTSQTVNVTYDAIDLALEKGDFCP
jgi:hypothetical protein